MATQTPEKREPTQIPAEPRFTREAPQEPAPPDATRPFLFALIGALGMGLVVIVAIVFAAGSGDSSSGTAPSVPAKAAATAPAKQTAAAAPAPSAHIAITLKEFTITPTPTIGRAGHVTFRVHNAGTMQHEFVVLRTSKPADALLKGNKASEAGHVGEIPGLAPGQTKTLRLDLKAGHYALICNMPGHYMAGQRIDFTVQ
jgi:uncharacterized cupredoxin-like copper-binding protein